MNNLKIDRAFIKDIERDDNDKEIVKMLINMAHSMNMTVIAEGVEEQIQLDILKAYGCHEIQGYLLNKPVSKDEITQLFNKYRLAPKD